jgi:hypothetical protein
MVTAAGWLRAGSRTLVPTLVLAGLLAIVVPGQASASPRLASAAGSGEGIAHFEWTAGPADTNGDAAFIDTGSTNGQPGDLLFVTPNPYRGATCPCLAIPPLPAIGVEYFRDIDQWAVVTENRSAMPSDESFNVLAEPQSGAGAFVLKATTASTHGDHTLINSPLTNGKPRAVIEVTPVVNPGGKSSVVFDRHPIGVRYYTTQHKWAVFNEDSAKMPAGASFNVLIGTLNSGGGTTAVVTATAADTVGRAVLFSNSQANGRPGSVSFATPDWNPGGKGGTTSKAQAVVGYDTPEQRWLVYGEDQSTAPPLGTSYNLLIYPSEQQPATSFEYTAGGSDTSGDAAFVNSRITNDEPGELLFVTPNPYRGATCPCLAVAPLPVIGVQYNRGLAQWAVVTENQSAMPADESFNVLAEPAAGSAVFVFKTAKSNTKGDRALINSGLLNDRPGAIIEVTAVINPGGKGAGVFNPHPVGVRYYPSRHQWAVFNEDGAPMPLGASFNLLVTASASGGGFSKVLTVTKTNTLGRLVLFSTIQSNNQPGSMTFVTPNWNPGGKGGTTFLGQTAVGYYPNDGLWGVFGEALAKAPPVGAAFNLLVYSAP